MAESVIRASGLVKRFGRTAALAGLDLEVQRGEVFGFLGPNGAGKSTTIRILLDLLRPDAGVVELWGVAPARAGAAVRARIGYLPGDLALSPRPSAREHLRYLSALRGGRGMERIEPLAERFGLDLDRPFRALSRGNRQKVGVVQAFMHNPELLILDEPTTGLDPLLQREFGVLVREASAAGATVFMSSHVLHEVEAVADRVAVVRAGVVVDVDGVQRLRERSGQRIRVTFAEEPAAAAFVGVPGLSEVRVEGCTLVGVLRGEADALVKAIAQHRVVAFSARERDLEESFLDAYRGAGDERAR